MSPDSPFSIYFAGGLFDHKQLVGNVILGRYIEKVSEGRYNVNLPQDLETPVNRATAIRNEDLLHVMKNDLAIFNFDGTELDSGTVVEMMFAKLLDIPCVILRTDFRNGGDVKDGDPWNLMCSAYPRTRSVIIHSMVWYQEAKAAAASHEQFEEILYTRMAKAVVEQLDEVRQEKPVSTDTVDVQELYKWALHFPGAGLQDTPHSLLRSVLRRKISKGLLPAPKCDIIPAHTQRLHRDLRALQTLAAEMQAETPVTFDRTVLNEATIGECNAIWQELLQIDRIYGDALEEITMEDESVDRPATVKQLNEAGEHVRVRVTALQIRAEELKRGRALEFVKSCKMQTVQKQEAALANYLDEAARVAEDIATRCARELNRLGQDFD